MIPNSTKILIAGGGIGGLTLALALQRRGFPVRVFERAPVLQPVGAGIVLAINAMRVLRRLGLQDQLLARGRQITQTELKLANGTSLGAQSLEPFSKMYGGISIAIHRADLHAALAEALAPGTLILGEELTGITEPADCAEAVFQSGRRERADCIVGADGLNSAVRKFVLPNEGPPRYAGYTCWRGVCDLADCASAEPINAVTETWGRGARFGLVPIGAGRLYWFATRNAPQNQTLSLEEMRAGLARTYGAWHAPIGAVLDATDSSKIIHHDILDRPPVQGWARGRVILLGDAVHPTTPNMGQGAAMAIESAAVLDEALAHETTLHGAFAVYELSRRKRTRWVTEQSWTFGKLGQMQNAAGCFFRDLVMRLVPASMKAAPMRRLFSYDATISDKPTPHP